MYIQGVRVGIQHVVHTCTLKQGKLRVILKQLLCCVHTQCHCACVKKLEAYCQLAPDATKVFEPPYCSTSSITDGAL